MKFKINELEIPYRVIYTHTKHAYIRIDRDTVVITIPKNSAIDPCILMSKHRRWIERRYREVMLSKRTAWKNRILLKGKEYRIIVKNGKGIHRESDMIILGAKSRAEAVLLLANFLKEESSNIVANKLDRYVKALQVNYNKVSFKESSRWGSCSSKGNLNFNLQLACLPEELAEYVIIHEVAHLKELNHSKTFWSIISSLCHDYKEKHERLKEYNICKLEDAIPILDDHIL